MGRGNGRHRDAVRDHFLSIGTGDSRVHGDGRSEHLRNFLGVCCSRFVPMRDGPIFAEGLERIALQANRNFTDGHYTGSHRSIGRRECLAGDPPIMSKFVWHRVVSDAEAYGHNPEIPGAAAAIRLGRACAGCEGGRTAAPGQELTVPTGPWRPEAVIGTKSKLSLGGAANSETGTLDANRSSPARISPKELFTSSARGT